MGKRQGRAMSIARHRLRACILVAILAFTLLGVESRRGGSLSTSGSFVMVPGSAANRAGNDELEDDMTGFEDAGLSESLDESEVIPVLLSHELGESGSTHKSSGIGYLISLAEVQKQCPASRLQCPSGPKVAPRVARRRAKRNTRRRSRAKRNARRRAKRNAKRRAKRNAKRRAKRNARQMGKHAGTTYSLDLFPADMYNASTMPQITTNERIQTDAILSGSSGGLKGAAGAPRKHGCHHTCATCITIKNGLDMRKYACITCPSVGYSRSLKFTYYYKNKLMAIGTCEKLKTPSLSAHGWSLGTYQSSCASRATSSLVNPAAVLLCTKDGYSQTTLANKIKLPGAKSKYFNVLCSLHKWVWCIKHGQSRKCVTKKKATCEGIRPHNSGRYNRRVHRCDDALKVWGLQARAPAFLCSSAAMTW